ncbi:hypothetical protein U9M48_013823 [Paspalum notatum var. saurae]|uniref:Uncharacterized protein n=1 Tax=Paspalum notatum var. saurae TaxID=547442 RepID=A0AAQ3T098_PASNO
MVVPSLNHPRQGTKMHIKQLKICQGSKMESTGQSGQVGRPGAWSPDPLTGSANPKLSRPAF